MTGQSISFMQMSAGSKQKRKIPDFFSKKFLTNQHFLAIIQELPKTAGVKA